MAKDEEVEWRRMRRLNLYNHYIPLLISINIVGRGLLIEFILVIDLG